jgi:hypothetical protein
MHVANSKPVARNAASRRAACAMSQEFESANARSARTGPAMYSATMPARLVEIIASCVAASGISQVGAYSADPPSAVTRAAPTCKPLVNARAGSAQSRRLADSDCDGCQSLPGCDRRLHRRRKNLCEYFCTLFVVCSADDLSSRWRGWSGLPSRCPQWLESNRRDKRPAHEYSLSEFGLSEERGCATILRSIELLF